MSPLEQLTQKIITSVPSIVELKFGCETDFGIITKIDKNIIYLNGEEEYVTFGQVKRNKVEILGRPILLEDVLIVFNKQMMNNIAVDVTGEIFVYGKNGYLKIASWLLNTPLHLQSEETISEINKLIK